MASLDSPARRQALVATVVYAVSAVVLAVVAWMFQTLQ